MKEIDGSERAGELGMRTRAVHAGEAPDPSTGAVIPPLVMTNTYVVDADQPFSVEDLEGEDAPFIYTRWGNPTVARMEEKVAALEGGQAALEGGEGVLDGGEAALDAEVAALGFASGMAAITGLFLQHLSQGDHLVCANVAYAGVIEFVHDMLPKMGVEVSLVDTSDVQAVADALRPETRLVFVETPCNPILRLTDIAAVAELAHEAGALLAVDSTFATPVATRPLEHGADYVVHSLTKYLGGHGDALGGIVVGKRERVEALRHRIVVHVGGVISPFNAWLILRGMATLPLRMAAHAEGALQVARFLEEHPRVERVVYPGLESHPQHELARRQMDSFSGMVVARVRGAAELSKRLPERLRVFHYAVSLGHLSSLIFYLDTDALMASTFRLEGAELDKYRSVAGDGIFRLSVGIEDPDDLCRDLERALD